MFIFPQGEMPGHFANRSRHALRQDRFLVGGDAGAAERTAPDVFGEPGLDSSGSSSVCRMLGEL